MQCSRSASTEPFRDPWQSLRMSRFRRATSWIVAFRSDSKGALAEVAGLLDGLAASDSLVVVDVGSTEDIADVIFDKFGEDDRLRIVRVGAAAEDPLGTGASHAMHKSRSVESRRLIRPSTADSGRRLEEPRVLKDPAPIEPAGKAILMPAAAYHLDELGPLAQELERLGQPCAFYASGWRWKHVARPLRSYRQPIFDWEGPGDWVDGVAAIVTLNDWGEPLRDIIQRAKDVGIPTFAKVEGVQDFDDVDVPWDRQAYRTAERTLCQGANDVSSLAGQETTIVGNSRLEQIWERPFAETGGDTAVINLNFTYGVMEEARDAWLADAVEASRSAGLEPIVSRHPAEHGPVEGVPVATEPMAHLLTTAAVLITRFSTVPFEAIARGTPFVYYNPHGESVPTFSSPEGAFDAVTLRGDLVEALARAKGQTRSGFRQQATAFFQAQVHIDPAHSSAKRTADAIMAAIARRQEGSV